MKRLLLVTMLMLTMLLAACGGASDGDNTGDATDMAAEGGDTCMGIAVEPDATVVFSGWGDETEQQVYRDSITRFNEACPSVTIDYQPVPADFQTQIKAAFAGGDAPDVIYVDDSLMTALGRTGQLLALDDFMASADITREEFVPALLDIFTVDGKTYPAGTGFITSLHAANHDPDVFENPGAFKPGRDMGRAHLSFSFGMHQCLGQFLARLELKIGMQTLFHGLPELRLDRPASELSFHGGAGPS